jgi:hypothetical protein
MSFDYSDPGIGPAYARVRDTVGQWAVLAYAAGSKTQLSLDGAGDGGVDGLIAHLAGEPRLAFAALHHPAKGVVAVAVVPASTPAVFRATATGIHFNLILGDVFKVRTAVGAKRPGKPEGQTELPGVGSPSVQCSPSAVSLLCSLRLGAACRSVAWRTVRADAEPVLLCSAPLAPP